MKLKLKTAKQSPASFIALSWLYVKNSGAFKYISNPTKESQRCFSIFIACRDNGLIKTELIWLIHDFLPIEKELSCNLHAWIYFSAHYWSSSDCYQLSSGFVAFNIKAALWTLEQRVSALTSGYWTSTFRMLILIYNFRDVTKRFWISRRSWRRFSSSLL